MARASNRAKRRELQELRDLRKRLLRDLGELAIDMHRSDDFDDILLQRKASAISALDAEANSVRKTIR